MDYTDGDYSDYDDYNDSYVPSMPCDMDSFRNWENTLQLYFYSLACAVGVVGNIVVILSYACCCRKTRKCMTMTDVYLINMAVVDLVFVMVLPVTIFYEHNVVACKCAMGAYSIKLLCTALLLACLSGDRYAAIVRTKCSCSAVAQARETSMLQDGDADMAQARETSMLQDGDADMAQGKDSFMLQDGDGGMAQGKDSSMLQPMERSSLLQDGDSSMAHPRERSWMYRLLVSLAIWSLAVILSVPTFIYTTLHQSSVDQSFLHPDFNQGYKYVAHDLDQSYEDHDLDQSYEDHDLDQSFAEYHLIVPAECFLNFNIVQMSLAFFLPLLVAGFCCVCITVALLRTKPLKWHESTCVVLTVVFAMCHLPYNAALLYHATNWKTEMTCDAELKLETVLVVTQIVAYVHSCLYPILYALTAGVFRCCVQWRMNSIWRSASRQASDLYIPAQTQTKEPEGPDENLSSSTTVC